MLPQLVFDRLNALPPEHLYWRNQWMFTRPVFTAESRQGADIAAFQQWAAQQPQALQRYINQAPAA